jgi:hypothetical protein
MNGKSDLTNGHRRTEQQITTAKTKKPRGLLWIFAGGMLICGILPLLLVSVFSRGSYIFAMPVPTPKPGDIQVSETFDGNYRWSTLTTADVAIQVANGRLSIEANKVNTFYTVPFESMKGGTDYSISKGGGQTEWLQQGNIDMTFDATVESDSGSYAQIGATCRYQNAQNFYSFIIVSDGRFSIFKEVNDKVTNLHPWTFSDAIHASQMKNKIHIRCSGDQLSFEVNDSNLATVTDRDLASGIIALLAGPAGDARNIKAHFDNLVIRAP